MQALYSQSQVAFSSTLQMRLVCLFQILRYSNVNDAQEQYSRLAEQNMHLETFYNPCVPRTHPASCPAQPPLHSLHTHTLSLIFKREKQRRSKASYTNVSRSQSSSLFYFLPPAWQRHARSLAFRSAPPASFWKLSAAAPPWSCERLSCA